MLLFFWNIQWQTVYLEYYHSVCFRLNFSYSIQMKGFGAQRVTVSYCYCLLCVELNVDKHKQIWILYKRRSAQLLECDFTVQRGACYRRVMAKRVSF